MRSVLPLLSIFLFAACGLRLPRHVPAETEPMVEKNLPNEWLGWQRSFPDTSFDWQQYHRAIEQHHQAEAARSADPCLGYRPDWMFEGPYNVGGRANTLVMHPHNENILLAGFANGGIFKTTNGGDNWYPVFEPHLNLSIGVLKFDPTNPSVMYCGTGDPNVPGVLFVGSGIFKSTDTGETWQYLGLAEAGTITQICIHPNNPQIIYAASLGNATVRNNHRGIYKSTDGGLTWQNVLFVAPQAGASDLQMNPFDPDVLYASFWDRFRSNTESIAYGPHAKIFKTTNGGKTWTQLTQGLPTGTHSRTGIIMSQQNPNKLYAVYIDSTYEKSPVFKTTDGGATWQPVPGLNANGVVGGFGWYFAKLRLHPRNDEELFFLGVLLWRRAPGAQQFGIFGGMHADVHDLIISPSEVRFSATDGGIYRNRPGQGPWTRLKLPTTQFYHVNYNRWDGKWYGGAQDNGVTKGNRNAANGWEFVLPNDGFMMQFHPTDPNQMWGMTQNGVCWYSADGGNQFVSSGNCLGTTDRCGWDTPLLVSQHAHHKKLYAATFRVYETEADGQPSWAFISPDLTDGNIYGARFHTVSCLAESPLVAGKLMAGTSDANVWRREPSGQWFNITGTLPNRYVTAVKLSPTFANRLYVTHSGWRNNERIPHVHRSDDNGATWLDISGDLPNFPVNDVLIIPGHRDSVLVVGTDVGVYFTKNYGKNWHPLGAKFPNVPVFDLEINPTLREIGAGTYARGLFTLKIDSLFAQTFSTSFQIHGSVTTAHDGSGVTNVQILHQKTDATGQFYLPHLSACHAYTLEPRRLDNPLNGVTTFDLLLISRHILNVQPFHSPIQYLAADANNSKSITANDIVTLRKLILGIDTVLAKRPSWDFLPKNFQFHHPQNPFLDSFPKSYVIDYHNFKTISPHFWAYKVGDLNFNAQPHLLPNDDRNAERLLPTCPLVYHITDADELGRVQVIFSTPQSDWAAMQFSLHFNPKWANLLEIKSLHPSWDASCFNLLQKDAGIVAVAAEHPTADTDKTMPASTPLFALLFQTRHPSPAAMPQFRLTSQPTAMAVFNADGKQWLPVLQPHTTRHAVPQVRCRQQLSALGSVEAVFFEFHHFDACTVRLSLWDTQGKLLTTETFDLPGGDAATERVVRLPAGATGLIAWHLETSDGQVFGGK